MNTICNGFGKNLKRLRKSCGMTQEKLAESIGINLRQLARIEAGESFVTSDTIQRICIVLGVSPYMLFDFEIKGNKNVLEQYKNVRQKLFKFLKNKDKMEFVNTALDSLDDKKALEKLKYLIKGVEISFKK